MKVIITQKEFEALKNDLKDKNLSMTVASGSMEPVIMTGEPIEVTMVKEPLAPFDIIVFWNTEVFIGHMVWHVNTIPSHDGQRVIVTRPLKRGADDFPITENQILGKIISHRVPWIWRVRLSLRAMFKKSW